MNDCRKITSHSRKAIFMLTYSVNNDRHLVVVLRLFYQNAYWVDIWAFKISSPSFLLFNSLHIHLALCLVY